MISTGEQVGRRRRHRSGGSAEADRELRGGVTGTAGFGWDERQTAKCGFLLEPHLTLPLLD